MFGKKLDLSMLKDAGDADVDALAPPGDYLEELRDARWDTLPTFAAKVENLNRRMRRLEAAKPTGIEAKAKKAAKWIGIVAVAAGSAVAPLQGLWSNWRNHGITAEQPKLSNGASLTIDRVPRPDAGAR